MKNHIKYEVKNIAYTATMTVNKKDENDNGWYTARTAANHFIQSAVLVPEGEFLGWQAELNTDGVADVSTFASAGVSVTEDDLNWIFDDCADVAVSVDRISINESDRYNYTLAWIEDSPNDLYDVINRSKSFFEKDEYIDPNFKELFNMLAAENASICMIAGAANEAAQAHGAVVISLPERMSLRLKSKVAGTLPHVAVKESYSDAAGDAGYDCLPDKCFAATMAGILEGLMNRTLTEEHNTNCESFPDEDMVLSAELQDNTDSTSINELGLSIRTYNCLRRYGIGTIGELRAVSVHELRRVRNLGKKGIDEIADKLSAYKSRAACIHANEEMKKPLTYMQQLDQLIGLDGVKGQIRRIIAFSRMKKALESAGKDSHRIVLNMEFVGNPGTAKTTVARILAGIFYENGLLESPDIVEAGRADLVAKYTGQTAVKVQELFANAEGKLLFIDEAYSLVDGVRGEFGDEAISTIVQEMENNREKTIVILAGYPDKMKEFFDVNPGLRSRVPFSISFADYSAEEMLKIAELESAKRGFHLSDEASDKVLDICRQVSGNADAGNGRFCRNLVDQAVLEYAVRVYGFEGEPGESNFELIPDDFSSQAVPVKSKRTVTMGFRAC